MSEISALGRNWFPRIYEERTVYRLMNELNISDLQARLLLSRELSEHEIDSFLDPKLKTLLPDPFHLLDMDKACNRAAEAILSREKIIVFGDYDVDGATSSALLQLLFNELGADCEVYIPDRLTEGYGPSEQAMDKFKALGKKVVFTVDCGALAFEPLAYAKTLGLDVIVLDHHQGEVKLPEAVAIINPNRVDETTHLRNLAAVGVTFLFAVGLIITLRNRNYFTERSEPNLLNYLDIVALGTVCDMMTITGLNRAFVKQGLKVMSGRKNIGLKTLADLARIDSTLSCYHLGFVLGPRINAGGRVGKSYLGSYLLSTSCNNQANLYALELEQYNNERKELEISVFEEAWEQAQKLLHKNYILVAGENWHPGVIGVVAGKLKERLLKPVAVVALDENFGKASCRSVKGVDFGSKIVKARMDGLLIAGGGHAMAAGFTVERHRLPELIDYFDEVTAKESEIITLNNNKHYDLNICPRGLTLELVGELNKLEPFGNGNPEPIIKVEGLFVLKAQVSNDKHISCLLAPDRSAFGNSAIRAIAFNSFGTQIGDVLLASRPHKLSIYGNLKINHWQQRQNLQLIIIDLRVEG